MRWLPWVGLVGCAAETWISEVGVNELMAGDPAGDWVELHNVTDGPIDLTGWAMEVDGAVSAIVVEPITAGGFLTVRVDLPDEGGEVVLVDEGAAVVDEVGYPAPEEGIAFGRLPDAAPNWQVLEMPTPGVGNEP